MSHIKGSLLWTDAIFDGFTPDKNGLILRLGDGTSRTMNYVNWEDAYPITQRKLESLSKGQSIKFATWNEYNAEKWFCDVEMTL